MSLQRPRGLALRSLLSIDLGAVTGWAFGGFADVRPECGAWPLPKTDPLDLGAARIAAFENTLGPALDRWEPSIVVCAEPFRSRNMGEAEAMLGLMGILRTEAWRRDLHVLRQPETTVRKEMLGRGRLPTGDMKELVMRWCSAQGIEVSDHNSGDAAVLWRWARDELVRQREFRTG